MKSTAALEPAPAGATELPSPRRSARWRWSTSRGALVAGGALSAAIGLGASTAGAATSTSGPPAGAHGQPPNGARPTVAGKITALSGDDITVQGKNSTSTTVIVSSGTTYKTMKGANGGSSTSSRSALKVGDFIAVQGTKNSDGSVTASSILFGTGLPPGPGAPSA